MELAPRSTIDTGLIEGRPCFVCGAHALHAVHVEGVPDYVTCSDCRSAFVLDQTGDWLMYGMINQAYPETRRVALRQWARPEDVMQSATEDRRLAAVELAAEELPQVAAAEELPLPDVPASGPAAEADDLDPAALPALFADEPALEDMPASPWGLPLPDMPRQDGEGDLDDFSSRLAALAGVPIEDLLFDRQDEAFGMTGQDDLGTVDEFAAGAVGSDDWLILPEEPGMSPPPQDQPQAGDGPDPLRSLWRAAPAALDVFALSPLAGQPEAAEAPGEAISLADRLAPAVAEAPAAAKSAQGEANAAPLDSQVEAASDPPAGLRYRTVIRGTRVQLPGGACAHCMSTPARRKLSVRGSLPAGQVLGQRRATRFSIPLCSRCHRRASSRTPEERSARLQAHLISALVALFVLVVTLMLDVVNLQGGGEVSGVLLLIILVLGYAIPAFMLSNRANRFLPPADALFVQTTLLVPEETQGLETAFEWRNREYAERFLEANQEAVLGRAIQVKDRSELTA
ncbi:MAG: hypothetical protein MUO23_02740 [Anaerolineales bacterium]|nr:hypothetical protein [Anaerolineales bacterium]